MGSHFERYEVESSGETRGDAIAPPPSLGDEVYQRLLADLVSLRLPAEERLSVDALSRRFGVSQTPVRAALIRLEAEGLVVKKHYSGYSVAPLPSAGRLSNIIEARLLLEPSNAARAAERASAEEISGMEAIAHEMARLLQEDPLENTPRLIILDSRFHAAVTAACGNDIIADMLERVFTQMHIFRLRYQDNITRDVIEEHLTILEAIRNRDPQRAEDAMRRHVGMARDRIRPHAVED